MTHDGPAAAPFTGAAPGRPSFSDQRSPFGPLPRSTAAPRAGRAHRPDYPEIQDACSATDPGATTRAQIADTDEAILAFAVTTREPDHEVHPQDGPGGSHAKNGSRSAPTSPPAACSEPPRQAVHETTPAARSGRGHRSAQRRRVTRAVAKPSHRSRSRNCPVKEHHPCSTPACSPPRPASPPPPPPTTRARRRSMSERDEFGALDGAPGLFRSTLEPAGLHAREDLGHASLRVADHAKT